MTLVDRIERLELHAVPMPLGPRAAGGGRAVIRASGNPGPPTPPPGNAGLEDVRGVETTEKLP